MRPEEYSTSKLEKWMDKERILSLDRVAAALGRPSRVTVFRKLAQLGGRASYSHRGGYQTLDRIAEYDDNGLWAFQGVRFSRQGTLLRTIVHLVEHSREGCFASELQALLEVRVHNALAHLYEAKLLRREQHADRYLYVSPTGGAGQLERRSEAIQHARERESASVAEMPGETREGMRLLLSVLNEKQRRLYLGLESIRLGHGGDAAISRIAGVNAKTIALGRRQLQEGDITAERIRKAGAGRPPVKKKDVIALLDELMKTDTAGDPMSDRKWSRRDTRSISREMSAKGAQVCPNTVARLLKDSKYSLRVNRKTIAETQHPERNRQFELIADFRKRFEDAGHPILSMDTN